MHGSTLWLQNVIIPFKIKKKKKKKNKKTTQAFGPRLLMFNFQKKVSEVSISARVKTP